MDKKILKVFFILAISIIAIVFICFFSTKNNNKEIGKENKENTEKKWEKISLENYYFNDDCNIKMDLDGNGIEEVIEIKISEIYIIINGNEHITNKKAKDEDNTGMFPNFNSNQYYMVDLNKDNIIEIIHRTYSDMISPITSYYTIYNFYNNELYEVGKMSFTGNMPNEIYVKDDSFKFKYWPYESPEGYEKEIVTKLELKYKKTDDKNNKFILRYNDGISGQEDSIEWSYEIDLNKKESTKFCSSTGILQDEELIEENGYNKRETRTMTEEELKVIKKILNEQDKYKNENSSNSGYILYNEETRLFISLDDLNVSMLESITKGY